jgi:putative nucleotidyltransferase with HDIG domain
MPTAPATDGQHAPQPSTTGAPLLPVAETDHAHIKKVRVDQLLPGMYVCDFNAGWLEHPFLFNRLHISCAAEINDIRRHGITEVLIDTRRGCDLPDAPTLDEVSASTTRDMVDQVEAAPIPAASMRKQPLAEEITRARRVLDQTAVLLQQALNDARLGQAIDVTPLRESANNISASVIRNASAMGLVCRLRERHEYTFTHSLNVSVLLASFSQHLGHDLTTTQDLCLGGLLHDIGKMAVDDAILNKPGKLTPDEFAHMKTHVDRGLMLVDAYPLPERTLQVIAEHHERRDGTGYPHGHSWEFISEAGRMAAIIDVYDAISSDRCYHQGLPAPEAMRRIFEWQSHFDASLVNQFVRCLGIYPVGSLVRLSSGRLAIVIEHQHHNLMRPRVRVIYDTRHRHYLAAEDLDLAAPRWQGKENITGHEDPARWGIDIARHSGCQS